MGLKRVGTPPTDAARLHVIGDSLKLAIDTLESEPAKRAIGAGLAGSISAYLRTIRLYAISDSPEPGSLRVGAALRRVK
jgi:hypothetical protein